MPEPCFNGHVRTALTALVLVVAVATVGPSAGSAQRATVARHERVARAVALSTVTIVTSVGDGAGFVVGDERWIVTDFDLVEGAVPASILVHFASGTTRSAHVLSSRSDCDLALLAIDGGTVPASPLTLADSDEVTVGQVVFASGTPFGIASRLTGGHVTARHDIVSGAAPLGGELIETDAEIPTGSVGAPLVDAQGRVIGMNWTRRQDGRMQHVAIPSNHVRTLLALVRAARSAAPSPVAPAADALAWIGVVGDDTIAGRLAGVRVMHVGVGTAAASAGILGARDSSSGGDVDGATGSSVGHVIAAIDGQPIGNVAELEAYLSSCAPGQTVRLSVWSGSGGAMQTSERTMVLPVLR